MLVRKERYREFGRYVAVGLSVTLLGLAVYHCLILLQMDYRIANAIAILLCKSYAYVMNKRFVFQTHCRSWIELGKEMERFFLSRGCTGVLDYIGLLVLVEIFNADKVEAKYGLQVVIIIVNYVLGKQIVFKQNEDQKRRKDKRESR